MKALIVDNLTKRFQAGHYSMVDPLKDLGYEVHWATNFNEYQDDINDIKVKIHQIDFKRNPFNIENIKAYKQLNELLEKEDFDLIHCNSPIGGVIGRICGNKANIKKIIYTAHGFHFYKGAPLINRVLYKGVEKYLARKTDALLTMNSEDFDNSKKFKLKNDSNDFYFVNGIGIDTSRYSNAQIDIKSKRAELGFKEDDIILIAMGDLIKRKNYQDSIKAISKCDNKNIHFCICGNGPLEDKLKNLSRKLNVENNIHFLGYRTDIDELLKMSDIFLFTTLQEGLPRSMMEAMASGLPVIVSDIRGNSDLLKNGEGGYLVESKNIDEITKAIENLVKDKSLRNKMKKKNLENIKKYDINVIKDNMKDIYKSIIGGIEVG